jgi:hypothetical protein
VRASSGYLRAAKKANVTEAEGTGVKEQKKR